MTKDKDSKTLDAELDALLQNKTPVAPKASKAAAAPMVSIELTAAEKDKIEAEAREEVAAELKKEKVKQFKAEAKQRLKKQVLFQHGKDEEGEELEAVLITLAAHTPWLTIDGKRYYPGRVYNFGQKLASVIKEQMYRGELHENEIRGKNMKEFYGQRPVGLKIGPNSALPAGVA